MYKVLVVAADPNQLNILKEMIRNSEPNAHAVDILWNSNGVSVFAASLPADILILDSSMPDGEAVVLTEQARQKNKSMKCIAISGRDIAEVSEAVALQADCILTKPVSPSALLHAMTIAAPKEQTNELLTETEDFPVCDMPFSDPLNWEFEQLLIHRQYHKCIGYLDELFREVSSSDHSRFPYLRNHCLEMTVYIVHLLSSYNIDINKLAGDTANLHYKLLHTQNPKELYKWMRHFLVAATEALENKNTRYSPCISRVVAHIEKHFAQDISLKTIAYDLNINAAYLGQLFKVETGQLFSVFLNKVRIANAKNLLVNTDLSLSEVSQHCGYTNISYFYNKFKKFTGKTPSQFRKSK